MICKSKPCRNRKIRARGLCAGCYVKAWRGGKFLKSSTDCKVDSCKGRHYGNGYCLAHYWQHRRNGSVTREALGATTETCTVQGCQNPHRARGLCIGHYYKSFSLFNKGWSWQESIDRIKELKIEEPVIEDELGPVNPSRLKLIRERLTIRKRKQEREIEYQLRGTAGDFDPWGDQGPDVVFDEQRYLEG